MRARQITGAQRAGARDGGRLLIGIASPFSGLGWRSPPQSCASGSPAMPLEGQSPGRSALQEQVARIHAKRARQLPDGPKGH